MEAIEFNPWNVSSLQEFLYYNCPECESKYSNREQFVGHAVVAHENARNILMTILKSEKVKASKEDKLIEEVDPEEFDGNGNNNNTGFHSVKVEPAEPITTEMNDDDQKEVTTGDNDELDETMDTPVGTTISYASNAESPSDAVKPKKKCKD